MKNLNLFNLKSIVRSKARWLLTLIAILTLGVGQMWGATQRYIYVGISNTLNNNIVDGQWGFNVWGGTDAGVKSCTYIADMNHDGRDYKVFRAYVYDDNNMAQFKPKDGWWEPGAGKSVTLNGTNNNAVFFSHSDDGWSGQFQIDYQVTSTASLSASSTTVAIGTSVTLTPSLSSNATYNEIKSTSYSVTTNPNSGGTVTSAGVFSATKAGSYTVTATVTYNAKDFTGITKTTTATKTITVYATVTFDKEGGSGGNDTQNATYNTATSSITAPTKTNYDFGGYYDGDNGTGNQIINASGVWQKNKSGFTDNSTTPKWIILTNVTLYAKWTPKTYSITYKDQGNVAYSGSNEASLPSSYTYGTGIATLTSGLKSGYSFDGWFTTSACTGDPVTSISSSDSGAKTFYAKWTENPGGTVTLTAGTGGQVSKDGSSWATNQYYTGIKTTDALAIKAQPNTGYTFSSWTITSGTGTIASTTTANTTYTPVANADATLTANFTEQMSTLTTSNSYNVGNPSYAVPTKSVSSIGIATTATLTATAAGTGYTFAGWELSSNLVVTNGDAATDRTITVRTNGDGAAATAQANYTEDLTTDYYIAGDGNGTGTDLTPGSPFAGWGTSGTRMYKKTGHSTESVCYCSFDVTTVATTDDHFPFKVYKSGNSTYYGNNGYWVTKENNQPTLSSSSGNNMKFRPYITGTYEFKLDYSTPTSPVLTVTWPEINQVRISAASPANAANVGNFDMGAAVSNVRKVTRSLAANTTYTFKVVYNSDWYGYDSGKFTRSNSTSSNPLTVTTSGGNMTLKTDYAGDYTFNFNQSTKALSVTYPTAYKVTFGKGTVNGSTGSCSAVNIDNGNSSVTSNSTWVKSGHQVKLTAPVAKEGYTFDGWFGNNSGTGEAITTNANCTITVSSAQTLYACYHLNNHAITHSASTNGSYTIQVGSAAAVSTNTTSDYGKTITLAATPATGYSFGSWSAYKTDEPATTVTVSSNQFTMPDYAVTVGATFSPTTYSITYHTNGGSAIAAGSYNIETATFALPTTSTKTGYTFAGWYTNSGLTGDPVASITVGSYGNKEYWAKWTPDTYTVSFDVNGGTASAPDSKDVTYDAAYGTLPSGMTHASKQFIGWYTDPDDGEGTHITAETIVSTAEDHTLYAHYENVYSVNVNFKCGSDVIYPSTSVNASPTSLAPTITAPEIFGYRFVNWTGTNVTPASATSATTTITATAATTITANYEVVPTVYFKNNLGWENVYVTFDAYFDGSHDNAPGNYGKPYFQMTQIGSSDVYYCVIPSRYTTSDYASWAWNIAFDNTGFSASDNEGTKTGAFDSGEFTGRGDFDPKATMYIPYNGDTETRNGGTFYKSGCWMKYNSTESGYQVKMNEYVNGAHDELSTTNLTAPTAGGYEFSAIVNLPKANYSYGFKLYKQYQKNTNDLWYTNTGDITSATDNLPWAFWSGSEITADTRRCGLHTEALGDYKITVSFATGKPMVNVEYPVSTGDWKLIYKDLATWSNGTHTAAWQHPSRVIKANANAEDIVSFYVAHGSSPSIELYKCTAIDAGTGAETWTKQSDVSLSGISKKGVYNFKVSQNGSKEATVTLDGEYTGNYYIRTDASDGGWSNYKTSGKNIMTYSEYSLTHGGDFPYSHYFMRYATAGTNIKFCIANDYSECVTDTVVDDTYTGEFIAANGNVRFMWNSSTNKIGRAYLSGSSVASDRFLVLEGDDKMFNESGKALTTAGSGKIDGLNDYEMKFTDNENWIYEATVQAQPGARIKLTAKYNDKIQYFYGAEGARTDETTDLLIGGSGTDKYSIRVVYDFKTNRLMKAFMPGGSSISTNLAINADLMIVREHQEEAQQITFNVGGSLSEVKTVYGAMKFNKYTVNGKAKTGGHEGTGASRYERDLFYISFPFDVKLSDVFGFGTYGTHWIIEYYDGKGRAEKGYWADSESNWKFVLPSQRSSFTLKAYEGYILALDLDEMGESSSVWNNGVEDVYVYFPSDGNVNNISATNRTITINQEGYECKINRATPDGNRTVKDSYWHCIGVPSFANYNSTLYNTNGGTAIDWTTSSMPYLYEWNPADNTLSVTSSATFDFQATFAYMVQYAGTSIYWNNVNVTPGVLARNADTTPKSIEFRLELQHNEQKADHTYIRMSDDEAVTTGFDFNYDLSKEFSKSKANLYTLISENNAGETRLTESAANCLPISEQTTVIPVGVKVTANADYTFAIPDGTSGVGVTLIDKLTGVRTNLSAVDYTVSLEEGTCDDRFVLEISPIKHVYTDISEQQADINGQQAESRKMLIDGLLYIVRDNKIYDARGARVQ